MANSKAVYVGSFDPITNGHLDIIERLSKHFDQVIVLISSSLQKKYLFNLEQRKAMVEKVCVQQKNITVDSWDGLLVDYMKQNKIQILVKGLRNSRDFDYEITMDHTNKTLYPEVETIYMIARAELSFVSSTLVKEIASHKGAVGKFVPKIVEAELHKKFNL